MKILSVQMSGINASSNTNNNHSNSVRAYSTPLNKKKSVSDVSFGGFFSSLKKIFTIKPLTKEELEKLKEYEKRKIMEKESDEEMIERITDELTRL